MLKFAICPYFTPIFNKKVVHPLVFLSKKLEIKTPFLKLRINFIHFVDLSILG